MNLYLVTALIHIHDENGCYGNRVVDSVWTDLDLAKKYASSAIKRGESNGNDRGEIVGFSVDFVVANTGGQSNIVNLPQTVAVFDIELQDWVDDVDDFGGTPIARA